MSLSIIEEAFVKIKDKSHDVLFVAYIKEYVEREKTENPVNTSDISAFKKLIKQKDKDKIAMLFSTIEYYTSFLEIGGAQRSVEKTMSEGCERLVHVIVRSKLTCTVSQVYEMLLAYKKAGSDYFKYWPVANTIKLFQPIIKQKGVSDELKEIVKELETWEEFGETKSVGPNMANVLLNLQNMVQVSEENEKGIEQKYLLEDDQFGKYVNDFLDHVSEEEKNKWYPLFDHCCKAKSGKPSDRFLKVSRELISVLGEDVFKSRIDEWFSFLSLIKTDKLIEHKTEFYSFLTTNNTLLVKGLIWVFADYIDPESLVVIGRICKNSFEKIPGIGQTASAVGKACLFAIANYNGLEGIGQLSLLKLKLKQSSTQKLIDQYLKEIAVRQGLSIDEIEGMTVPDFDLIDGSKTILFQDYTLTIQLEEEGKVNHAWYKSTGEIQKNVPRFIKESEQLSVLLQEVKDEIKEIQKALFTYSEILDRMFVSKKVWDPEVFQKYYLEHGFMSFFTKRLIWDFEGNGERKAVLWQKNSFVTLDLEEIQIDNKTKISLWHPINAEQNEIDQWQDLLNKLELHQPVKQAYREVYYLTESELTTGTYSNRMSAHILKQYPFCKLATAKGWKYKVIGSYDAGLPNWAEYYLPEYDIRVMYWLDEVQDCEMNEFRIWKYVSTDQVRFLRGEESIPLTDVPEIVFSEVMRDVGLFVTDASIGEDPEWYIRESPFELTNWCDKPDGAANEIIKTRKFILENLIPKLSISDKLTIEGDFLKVKGKLRNYKIHIGTTNVLMGSYDQALHLFPGNKPEVNIPNNLVYSRDIRLSIILSKAIMLSNDDKITDRAILRQFKARGHN